MGIDPENSQPTLKPDITTREDITQFLEVFYEKLLQDEVTRDVFKAIDMAHHIPVITDFWAMILLGDMTYKGNPFRKHVPLQLSADHFKQWLHYFSETINEFHAGEKAEMAKQRAQSIGHIFQSKLGIQPLQ